MSLNWTTLRAAVLTWATSTGRVAVWSDQVAPKPARPYVSVKIGPIATPAFAETRRGAAAGEYQHSTIKELNISVQVIADVTAAGGSTHVFEADKLVDALQTLGTIDAFQAAGISVIDTTSITDTTQYLDTEFEPKAVFDVRIYAVSTTIEQRTTQQGTVIESVVINGKTVSSP